MKWIMLMIILPIPKEITGKTDARTAQNEHERDVSQPIEGPVATLNMEVTILFKYLSNFCRYLDLPLINCEVELNLSWAKDGVLVEHSNSITGKDFKIRSTKLCDPVATLSILITLSFQNT